MATGANLPGIALIALSLYFHVSSCTSKVVLNACAQRIQGAYTVEQRKILKNTRRKDLPNIDLFYLALNGESATQARLYFKSGGSYAPKIWSLDYTCKSEAAAPTSSAQAARD